MIHHSTAENSKEIARLLRSRGRIVITAPPRCGKTTELIRYAEERFPNGRFAVVCAKEEDKKYILKLHWQIYNGYSFVDVCANRLLGKTMEGEEAIEPLIYTPESFFLTNQSIPVFADSWSLLPECTQRAIMKRKLFIASVTS